MAFKSLKNHISNLATPFLANSLNNFMNKSGAQDAGKMAAQLKRKSPFNNLKMLGVLASVSN